MGTTTSWESLAVVCGPRQAKNTHGLPAINKLSQAVHDFIHGLQSTLIYHMGSQRPEKSAMGLSLEQLRVKTQYLDFRSSTNVPYSTYSTAHGHFFFQQKSWKNFSKKAENLSFWKRNIWKTPQIVSQKLRKSSIWISTVPWTPDRSRSLTADTFAGTAGKNAKNTPRERRRHLW